MKKIASPQELQSELLRLLNLAQSDGVSRRAIAAELRDVAARVALSKTHWERGQQVLVQEAIHNPHSERVQYANKGRGQVDRLQGAIIILKDGTRWKSDGTYGFYAGGSRGQLDDEANSRIAPLNA